MICKYCNRDVPEIDFEIANIINGKSYRRLKCRQCKRERQNERRKEISDWVDDYKSTHPCVRCGNLDYRVLEFHHSDASAKEFNIADITSFGGSRRKILKEIEKCNVLCANCHRIFHWEEKNLGVV